MRFSLSLGSSTKMLPFNLQSNPSVYESIFSKKQRLGGGERNMVMHISISYSKIMGSIKREFSFALD